MRLEPVVAPRVEQSVADGLSEGRRLQTCNGGLSCNDMLVDGEATLSHCAYMHVDSLQERLRPRQEADPDARGQNLGETVEAKNAAYFRLLQF